MHLLDEFLNNYEVTLYQLSQVSGITEQTWENGAKLTTDDFTVKELKALGMVTNKSVGTVLDELIEIELKTDDLNGV